LPLSNIGAGFTNRGETINIEGRFRKVQPLFDLTTLEADLLLLLNEQLRFASPALF
jgi:hypothetical protein